MKTSVIGFLAMGMFALSINVMAANGAAMTETRTKTVRFSDLNLSNPADAQVLHSRIKKAARQVCGGPGVRGIDRERLQCERSAIEDSVQEVNEPQLWAVHRRLPASSVPG